MKTGNTYHAALYTCTTVWPQWSPVMKTGNTSRTSSRKSLIERASMEPGHEDREYQTIQYHGGNNHGASMEPGHEDREYALDLESRVLDEWASMEPGHEDREYGEADGDGRGPLPPQWSPVMKTGNTCPAAGGHQWRTNCLNGARS